MHGLFGGFHQTEGARSDPTLDRLKKPDASRSHSRAMNELAVESCRIRCRFLLQ